MRKTRALSLIVLASLLALSSAAWGQEKEGATTAPRPVEVRVNRLIEIKYADPKRLRDLVFMFGANLSVDEQMKVMAVSGTPETVAAVVEAVAKFDKPLPPAKNVELTAYILMLTRQAEGPSDIPPELHEVVSELGKVLSYKGFHLMNTELMRARDDSPAYVAETGGGNGPLAGQFSLSIHNVHVASQDQQQIVRLDSLAFTILPFDAKLNERTDRLQSPHIDTSIDIPVGQKVVVGKTGFDSPETAIVLVLTAKVVG